MCGIGAAMGMQAAGSLMSAIQQRQAGNMERKYYDYLASNAEKQAEIVKIQGDRQITNIQDRAAFDTRTQKEQVRAVEGSQKVGLAAAGVGAGSVTAEDISRDTMSKAAMDEALIRYSADLASDETMRQTTFEAGNLKNEARMLRLSGKMAQRAGNMNSFTTLLGGASQAANTWYYSRKYGGK